MAESILDVKGLACPLPILRAKKALRPLALGDVLEVLATDDAALGDFPTFCRQTGNELLSAETRAGVHHFRIRKDRE